MSSNIQIKKENLEKYKKYFNYNEFDVTEEEKKYYSEAEDEIINLGNRIIENTLKLGKRLSEVQNKMAKNRYGMFTLWFENLGLKKDFVYREINRWKMYEKYKIPKISEASTRTIEFLKQNSDRITDNEIKEILEVPTKASKKIKALKDDMEVKKFSMSPKIEARLINQKIDFYFEKIDKLSRRLEELNRQIEDEEA